MQNLPFGFLVSMLLPIPTTIFVATTGDSMSCVLIRTDAGTLRSFVVATAVPVSPVPLRSPWDGPRITPGKGRERRR